MPPEIDHPLKEEEIESWSPSCSLREIQEFERLGVWKAVVEVIDAQLKLIEDSWHGGDGLDSKPNIKIVELFAGEKKAFNFVKKIPDYIKNYIKQGESDEQAGPSGRRE